MKEELTRLVWDSAARQEEFKELGGFTKNE